MTLRLRLRQRPPISIDVASLSLATLCELSPYAVERLPLLVGNQQSEVGAWFEVTGSADDRVVFEGDCSTLCGIGSETAAGEVIVEGPAGDQLGRRMSAGVIHVRGSVGCLAASGMRGGRIEIEGDAGESLGGPLRGERTGMRGGRVVVRGNTAQATGHRMRRGTLIVQGCTGPRCGLEMIAGTIAAAHVDGTDLGFGMHRGTILVVDRPFESFVPRSTPCFSPPTVAPAGFLKLLLDDLATDWTTDDSGFDHRRTDRWRRTIGDLAVGGLGEVIW